MTTTTAWLMYLDWIVIVVGYVTRHHRSKVSVPGPPFLKVALLERQQSHEIDPSSVVRPCHNHL